MLHHPRIEGVKFFRLKGSVDRAPLHRVLGHLVTYDEFIAWGSSGAAGIADDGSIGREFGLSAPNRVLYQYSGRGIEVRPPCAQQLGNFADLHVASHWF